MKWRSLVLVLAMAVGAGVVQADPNRCLLTKENKFPKVGQLELGVLGTFAEYTDSDEQDIVVDANQYILTPQLRYQLTEEFTLVGKFPVGRYEPDQGDSSNGLGNLSLGFELLAYEDFRRFPYIIPYAMINLPTADEDVKIDYDEFGALFGMSAGSIAWRYWTFNADISYEFFEDSQNIARFTASILWDVDDDLAFIFEAGLSDNDRRTVSSTDYPAVFLGGISYDVNKRSSFQLYGGGESGTPLEVFATLRYNYTFF